MFADYLKKISNSIESGDRNNPSLFVLTGFLIAIIPLVVFDADLLKAILIILFFVGIGLIILPKKIFLKFILWIILGFITFAVSSGSFLFQNSIDNSSLLGKKEIKATVTDFKAVGNRFSWLHNPSYIEIKINGYRIYKNNEWKNCSVKVMAKIKNSNNVKYGDSLRLSGYLKLPEDQIVKGSFNYKNYLKSLGINYIFFGSIPKSVNYDLAGRKVVDIQTCESPNISVVSRILSGLFVIRNNLMDNLCSGITDNKTRTFLAGIIFGCRQDISRETKDIFINNGTIHILAISGLHVGILALFLLLVFRFLPIRLRFLLIPLILFVYVLLAGLQPSAVRAFVMISVFCLFRALFLSDKSFNNILFAALLLIISNPYVVVSGGFQFSFIITGILVLSWKKCAEWKNALFEKQTLIIEKKVSKFQKLKNKIYQKLFTASFVCLLAAIASAGLTLYYQKLIIPLAPLLNFIIVPLMFPLFLVSVIKIAVVSFLGNFLVIPFNEIISFFIGAIFQISILGDSFSTVIHTIYTPLFMVIVFYIFALIFIFIRVKYAKLISIFICCLVFVFGSYKSLTSNSQELFIIKSAGDDKGISYIYSDSLVSTVCIVNLPGNSGYVIKEVLENNNLKTIDCIFLSKTTKSYCENASYLIKNFSVKSLVVTENTRNSKYLKKLKTLCQTNNVEVTKSNYIKTPLRNIEFVQNIPQEVTNDRFTASFLSLNVDNKSGISEYTQLLKSTDIITDDAYILATDSPHQGLIKITLVKNGNVFKKLKLLNSNQTKVIRI